MPISTTMTAGASPAGPLPLFKRHSRFEAVSPAAWSASWTLYRPVRVHDRSVQGGFGCVHTVFTLTASQERSLPYDTFYGLRAGPTCMMLQLKRLVAP